MIPTPPLPLAIACKINTGILDADEIEMNHPAQIHMDDALLLRHSKWSILIKIATLIEAIFVVMGELDTTVRQCPLAMDKWEEFVIGPVQTMLGPVVNTYQLTIGIPSNYVNKDLSILNNTWHCGRKQSTVSEAQKLTGKLGHLMQGTTWIFHLLSHLYASIAYALSKNKRLLLKSSREFQDIVNSLKKGTYLGTNTKETRYISFAMKQDRYNINKTMRQEIDFFHKKLQPLSGTTWKTPIAHIIPIMPTATAVGGSCLEGTGGYSISLIYWWHLLFPKEVIQRTIIHKQDNKDGLLISINVLKSVTVVINYCAPMHVFMTKNITHNPHPVLLNVTNYASALSWGPTILAGTGNQKSAGF